MAAPLLTLQDIRLTIGTSELLSGAELFVAPGERICIVGRNGSGKSTLMKIAAGQVEPDGGRVFVQPGADIRYLPQEPDLSGYPDTHAYVAEGLPPGDDSRAYYLLGQLGFNGDEDVTTLSGGQARRVALARVLAPKPDVLLLDEPTNHLDLPTILWLEKELNSMKGALVLVSHDRRFLNALSKITVWLDRGTTRRLEQGFGEYEAWRDTILEAEEAARHKADRKIAAEEHWVKYGVTARRKRNVRRMSELKALREARRTARQQVGQVNMSVSDAPGAGTCIIAADHISKAFGDHEVVKDFSMRILRKDRIGIVGGNGAGKTTLIKLLTGKLAPDSGEVVLGTNLAVAGLDQVRTLDPDKTLAETLTGGGISEMIEVGGQKRHVNSYMQDFLFTPEQARTPVSVLSGGERARLLLAKALAKPANFLVLDEPTNDLDLETLDLLEDLIVEYPGTVLLVSHDRDFLDKTVSGVLMAEGNGAFTEYAGGYSDMVAQRGEGVTGMAEANHGTAATATPKAEKPKAAPRAANTKRKLTYADQYALENLPKEMEKLDTLMADLQQKMADPNLYSRDPTAFQKYSDALTKAQADHDAAEERWLELEIKREEIEGG